MAGLYIHIPFCASRCIYCGFYSTTLSGLKDLYVDAICKEMMMRKTSDIDTIYLGGGTPSQLSEQHLKKIFSTINEVYTVNKDAEITLEANPDDVTPEFAELLVGLGVNRVSMGAQTFNDSRLRFLNRRHCATEVQDAVDCLRKASIDNISIDLMFGFPNETLSEWESDIERALSLKPQHLSSYSLMYEEGTPLYRLLQQKKVCEIDEEVSLSMYNVLIDRLTEAGYEHYEISNFALPGFRSRHNSSYWHAIPYIGIGASAHSYLNLQRSWNVSDIRKYIDAILQGKRPCTIEKLDIATRYDDMITTALRTREGIDLRKMKDTFGEQLYRFLMNEAKDKIALNLMKIEDHHLSLTRKGLYISDSIMSDLMDV
jgi:oxygen-independent coproporphyrinogen-3 oxidase